MQPGVTARHPLENVPASRAGSVGYDRVGVEWLNAP